MTQTLYGLYGAASKDLLTYGGRVIVHHTRPELEHLFPNVRVVEVPPGLSADQMLPVQQHPEMCSVSWTADGHLVPGQFRDGS